MNIYIGCTNVHTMKSIKALSKCQIFFNTVWRSSFRIKSFIWETWIFPIIKFSDCFSITKSHKVFLREILFICIYHLYLPLISSSLFMFCDGTFYSLVSPGCVGLNDLYFDTSCFKCHWRLLTYSKCHISSYSNVCS